MHNVEMLVMKLHVSQQVKYTKIDLKVFNIWYSQTQAFIQIPCKVS